MARKGKAMQGRARQGISGWMMEDQERCRGIA
jgi:hypothetical protein